MRRKVLPLNIFLILLTVGIAGAQKLDSVTLYLKWDHQFEFAGYYAAIENGYYEEKGLHVDIDILRSGREQVEYIEAAPGRYGIANSNLLTYRMEGLNVVMLMPVFQHSSVVFFTHKRDSIFHPQDLVGKRVVIPKVIFPELYLMMFREGIEPSRTQIDSVWQLDKFLNREAEAIVQLSLDIPYMPDPDSINIIHPLQYGLDFYGELLYTSEVEIKRYPDRARKFREASILGWEYAMKHPSEMIDLIIAKYNPNADRDALMAEFEEVNELMLSGLIPVGQNNRGRWQSMYKEIDETGIENYESSLEGFFFEDYFETGEERLNTIITIFAILLAIVFFFLIIIWLINKRLNKVLDERMSEINLRNEELIKMNNELDNFVYRVSHDLRSPISSSMGLLNLMDKDESISGNMQEYIGLMRKSLFKLDNFILDILQYSRNSRMEVKQEIINFDELINEVIESIEYQDSQIEILVDVKDCYSFKGDKNRIFVILNNLISNSIRYGDHQKQNRHVNVTTRCQENQLTIIVEDNGIGIPEKSRDKVFEMFYRAHDEQVGSGLGLYIVKEVVDKLGGTIQMDSEVGVGTKITIQLTEQNS